MKTLAPTLIVAGLLAATATSFAVEERLKLEDSPVLKTKVESLFSPKKGEAKIGFQLRREEDIRLAIVDDQGTVVRNALGSGVFGRSFHQFAWDGRNDAGKIVPDGVYRVQLQLKDEDRTIEFPSTVRVDTTAPTIDVHLKHQVFSPDGDGRSDRVDIHYRFNEPAYAILYVNVAGLTNVAVANGSGCLFTRAAAGGLDTMVHTLCERGGLTIEHAREWLTHVDLCG